MAIVPPFRIVRPSRTAFTVLVLALASLPAAEARAADCAEVVATEGTVEVRRAGNGRWTPLERNDEVCGSDAVRVMAFSRATLKLADDSLLRLDANTAFTLAEPDSSEGTLLDRIRGWMHVISRDPRELRFSTPYANAGLEGTEFLIAGFEDRTEVTVLEGEVVLSNERGTVSIKSGERGTARGGAAPTAAPFGDAIEVVRWTAHFAPLLDPPLPSADAVPTEREAADPMFFAARAARRLELGRIAEAEDDLAAALRLEPDQPTARALQAVIAVERRTLDEAFRLAHAAVQAAPESPAARLALSLAYQADGRLADASREADAAVAADDASATAWARLAELRLAMGDYRGSVAAARRALELNDELGYAQSILGFAELTAMRSAAARDAFQAAVELDPVAPLPRLGLGLALIQSGDVERGRAELETAVILDPTESLARSYMAKAYHAERRAELTETQLGLAKELDPHDPTPWLYDALRKNSANRPAEALHDLERAYELNGRRTPYRSRLRIDEDLGARSAGYGRLYRELGFEGLALQRGWESVAADPTDHAGHRLLADVYSTLPRHEIARTSELYQAQLLQPINLVPIPPQLGEIGQFIAQTVGPGEPAFGDFYSLVSRNGLRLHASGVVAGMDTGGESIAVSGLHDRLSYGVGHYDFSTDGFRANNDLEQRVSNAFLHFRARPDTSIFAELRTSSVDKGDLQWLFDPAAFRPTLRQREDLDTVRVAARKDAIGAGTLLASLSYSEAGSHATSADEFSFTGTTRTHAVDAQYIGTYGRWSLRTGLAVLDRDGTTVLTAFFPGGSLENVAPLDGRDASVYAYARTGITPSLEIILGASLTDVSGRAVDDERAQPKVGLVWALGERTTLRAAAFETIQGPLTSRHDVHPRLEPVDVAGFNQFFFGSEGERARRYGVGIDHAFSPSLHGGVEASRRTTEFPTTIIEPSGETTVAVHTSEELHRAYMYWTPTANVALSAEYQHERFDNHGALYNGYTVMRAQRLPLGVRWFGPSGVSAGLRATYVRQDGLFTRLIDPQPRPLVAPEAGKDAFWTLDASLRYRLPNRRGVLSLNVANLLDERFRFQDTDPQNSELLPERMLYLRFTVAFD